MSSTRVRADIQADIDEVERRRQRTPRACALLDECHEALNEQNDDRRRMDLEALTYAVGEFVKFGTDVSEEGEQRIVARLQKLKGVAA